MDKTKTLNDEDVSKVVGGQWRTIVKGVMKEDAGGNFRCIIKDCNGTLKQGSLMGSLRWFYCDSCGKRYLKNTNVSDSWQVDI